LPDCAFTWLTKAANWLSIVLKLPLRKADCAARSVLTIFAATSGLVSYWLTSAIRSANEFCSTVKLVELPPWLPALSVAVALYEFTPRLNDEAGPLMFWHVLLAIPEPLPSLAAQVMLIVSPVL